MGHSVHEDLHEIEANLACLYNVTEANLNLMRDQLRSHPHFCELKKCSIRFILNKYARFLESVCEKINSHYYEFEKACINFESELLIDNICLKNYNSINKHEMNSWAEYSRHNRELMGLKSNQNDKRHDSKLIPIKEPTESRNVDLPCTSAKAAQYDEHHPFVSTPNNELKHTELFNFVDELQIPEEIMEENTNDLKELISSINQQTKQTDITPNELHNNEFTNVCEDVKKSQQVDLNNNIVTSPIDKKANEVPREDPIDLDENIACLAENRKILRRTRLTVNTSDTSSYKCYVSHVNSPFLFWIQLRDDSKVLSGLNKNIKKFYKDSVNNEKYKLSKVVESYYYAAKFSGNLEWYRAKVLNVNKKENKATVFYIDYGNIETLPISQIRILSGEFYNIISQAKPVSLSNAYPVSQNKEWHTLETKYFSDMVLNRSSEIKLKFLNSSWPIFFCNLTVFIKENSSKWSVDALQYLVDENIASKQKNDKIVSDFKNLIEDEVSYYGLGWSGPLNVASNTEVSSESDVLKGKAKDNQSVAPSTLQSEAYSVCYKDFSTSYHEIEKNKVELDEKLRFDFRLVHVNDPSNFYINNNNDEIYSRLDNDIYEYYAQHESLLLNSPNRVDFLKKSTVCIVKSPSNELFYRAMILSHNDQSLNVFYIDYGTTRSVSISNTFPFLKEFCYLPPYCIACTLQSIKPEKKDGWCSKAIDMFNKLALIDNIYEAKATTVNSGNQVESVKPGMLECSLDTKIGLFFYGENQVVINQELLKQNLGMLSKIMSNKIQNNPDELSIVDNLDSVSVNKIVNSKLAAKKTDSSLTLTMLPKEDEEFKKNRINQYVNYQANYAKSFENTKEPNKEITQQKPLVTQKNELEKQKSPLDKYDPLREVDESIKKSNGPNEQSYDAHNKQKPPVTEQVEPDDQQNQLDKWDPLKNHYESIRNSYGYNEQSYEAHTFGYETKRPDDICRQFQKYGKCHRNRCPFIHKQLSEELIFSSTVKEKKQIFSDVFNETKFVKDDLLLMSIVSYNEQFKFHAIVLGYFDRQLKRFVSCNNMKELDSNMSSYYGNKKFLEEKTTFYNVGQIVAVKARQLKDKWFRGRITEIHQADDLDKTIFQVFFLDIGIKKTLNIKDIYPINKRFCNQPLQSIHFTLASTTVKPGADLRKEFTKIVGNNGLCRASVFRSSADLLELEIYKDNLGNTINQSLVKLDLAEVKH